MHLKNTKVAHLVKEGDKLLEQKDFEGAEHAYRLALAEDPQSAETLWSIACVFAGRQQYDVAAEWARRAVDADETYAYGHAQLGNTLFGLGDFEAAIISLRRAVDLGAGKEPLAQAGLCLEKLGRWAEAEEAFRNVLEDDPSYSTRYAIMAMHSYSFFAADMHHALARVLQRQGKVEEAHLHYHLAKRNDPLLELDPMYREIMTEADLENHPEYDYCEIEAPSHDAEVVEKLKYIFSLARYDDFQKAIFDLIPEDLTSHLVGLIREAQAEGHYLLSAQIRLLGDVMTGKEQRELFIALRTVSWIRMFELATSLAHQERDALTTSQLAIQIDMDWSTVDFLLPLIERFVSFDPMSGLPLIQVVRSVLAHSPFPNHEAAALLTLGKAFQMLRRPSDAEEAVTLSLQVYERSQDRTGTKKALYALAGIQNDLGKKSDALATWSRCIQAIEADPLTIEHFETRYNRAIALYKLDRYEECYSEAIKLASLILNAEAVIKPITELRENLGILILGAGAQCGKTGMEQIVNSLASGGDEESMGSLRAQAHVLITDGKKEEAVDLLKRGCKIALDRNAYPFLVEILVDLGTLFIELERLDDAEEALSEAADRGERLASVVDLWRVFMARSYVAEKLGRSEQSIEHAERALVEARRNGDSDQEAETHMLLCRLLIETDTERALGHAGQFIHHPPIDKIAPEAWTQANSAFNDGRYEEAIKRFHQVLEDSSPVAAGLHLSSQTNIGSAFAAMGDFEEAIQWWERGVAHCMEHKNYSVLFELLKKIVDVCPQARKDTAPVREKLALIWSNLQSEVLGSQRETGIGIAEISKDLGDYELAEKAARHSLEISLSAEWRDIRAELRSRLILGSILRQTARYLEAITHYEKSLSCAQRLKDEPQEGMVRGWMAIAYKYSGQIDRAIAEYIKAITIGERYNQPMAIAGHSMNLAAVLFEIGRLEEGLTSARRALDVFDAAGERDMYLRTIGLIKQHMPEQDVPADLKEMMGRYAETALHSYDLTVRSRAEAALASRMACEGDVEGAMVILDSILTAFHVRNDRYNEAKTLINRATILWQIGKNPRPDALLARLIAEEIGNERLIVDCDKIILRLCISIDDREGVIQQLSRLIPRWQLLRRNLKIDSDRIAFADEIVHITEASATYFLAHGETDRAFDLYDCGHAAALQDLLLEAEGTAELILEVEQPPSALMCARDICTDLGDRALIVTFGYADDQMVALAVRNDGTAPAVCRTGLKREDIRELREAFDHEMHMYRGTGYLTWRDMAKPLLSALEPLIRHDDLLIVILEEDIRTIPLYAVELPQGELLIDRAAVVTVPSVAVLHALYQRKSSAARGILDVISIGAAFPDEAMAILHTFPGMGVTGNQLSKLQVRELIQGKAVVHFSCHGYFNPIDYRESGLIFGDTKTYLQQNVISVRDLLEWKLDNQLVTLSACETARGKVATSEFLDLSRAFLASGAQSVVATLWAVDRAPTVQCMLSFYRRLKEAQQQSSVLDLAQALRAAQREFAQQYKVYDWAAFSLIGWPIMYLKERA